MIGLVCRPRSKVSHAHWTERNRATRTLNLCLANLSIQTLYLCALLLNHHGGITLNIYKRHFNT